MVNKIWQERLEKSQKIIKERKNKKQKRRDYAWKFFVILFVFRFFWPQYWKRLIYPSLYGKPTSQKLEISRYDHFEDLPENTPPIYLKYDSYTYELTPRTKYSVTGRIGYVEPYDGVWNKFYRGHTQKHYINLVPIDFVIVIGDMAKPEIYNLFEFFHEERSGGAKCKGVTYKTSFLNGSLSPEEIERYENCKPHDKDEELNNYHPIPANENIRKALHSILPNDVVYLEGILVDVNSNGLHLNTGTRKLQHHKYVVAGFNPGMCFVLYTTKVIFNNHVYE